MRVSPCQGCVHGVRGSLILSAHAVNLEEAQVKLAEKEAQLLEVQVQLQLTTTSKKVGRQLRTLITWPGFGGPLRGAGP